MTSPSAPTGWDELTDACAAAAAALPAAQVRLMAERAAEVDDPMSVTRIQDRPPTRNFRERASAVVNAWRAAHPPPAGPVVAGMLLAAARATSRTRAEQTIDLVWTGPGTASIHARPTSPVAIGLIGEARRNLVLSTFASRRVPQIHQALAAAADRGVKITLILENEASSNGQYHAPSRDPFEGIPAEILEWPLEQRQPAGAWYPAMHAKYVLTDQKALFVTSANLTGSALDRNIETGVLIRGGPLPGRLYQHLRDLAYDGTLRHVQ